MLRHRLRLAHRPRPHPPRLTRAEKPTRAFLTAAPARLVTGPRGRYTTTDCQARPAARGMIRQMSRSGQCLDNAMAESFFATLTCECTALRRSPTRAAARTVIFERLEVFYNRQRPHSALAYRPPAASEGELLSSDRAAWQ